MRNDTFSTIVKSPAKLGKRKRQDWLVEEFLVMSQLTVKSCLILGLRKVVVRVRVRAHITLLLTNSFCHFVTFVSLFVMDQKRNAQCEGKTANYESSDAKPFM